ncbi:MAG: hypothetical protein BJ554DRAFT_8464, partial [Olpidium bornovanus]
PFALRPTIPLSRSGLWEDVLAEHARDPFHYLVGVGDQLYCDDVWSQVPELAAWIKMKVERRLDAPLAKSTRAGVADFYFRRYLSAFATGERFARALKLMPTMMVLGEESRSLPREGNDHDLFDGAGSYPDELRLSPVMNGVAQIGYNFYLLFQLHTNPELSRSHGFFGGPGAHNFLAQLTPEVAVLGMDGRRERTLDRVASRESYDAMFRALESRVPPTNRHLLALLGVPILYPRLTIAEGLLQSLDSANRASNGLLYRSGLFGSLMGSLGAQPELLDDLGGGLTGEGDVRVCTSSFPRLFAPADHWTTLRHSREREAFIKSLQNYAAAYSTRVTFVSG